MKNEVAQLKGLSTNYGTVNILNIHISEFATDRVLFPKDLESSKGQHGRLLFEISTPLNENMVRIAQQKGYNVEAGAKGYVLNGNAIDLINFLNIGTPQ